MRDLVFKNIACPEKKRRIIATSEVADNQGVRSIIRRHFICIVREIKDYNRPEPSPYLYILKERNTNEHKERFFCKIKGNACAVIEDRIFLILFTHSLSISLARLPADAEEKIG